jgi:predicted XRE-type DNA-binding protein
MDKNISVAYQLKQDVELTPADYINVIHGRHDSYISHAYQYKKKNGEIKWIQKQLTKNEFISNNLYKAVGSYDNYVTLNQLYVKYNRNKNNVTTFCNLYVDLDFYKIGYTLDKVRSILDKSYYNIRIPKPTFEIFSGRGLYLIWCIKPIPRPVDFLWQNIQNYLAKVLSPLNADSQVSSDRARVLRLPGSINSKSDLEVKILSYSDIVYNVNDIIDTYLPKKKLYPKKDNKQKKDKVKKLHTLPNMFNTWARDIEKLCELRDYSNKRSENHRDLLLFYYINSLMPLLYYSDNKNTDRDIIAKQALKKALKLNSTFIDSLQEKTVRGYLSSSIDVFKRTGKGYKLNNAKIIRALNITPEEQKQMHIIISKNEKNNRFNKSRQYKRRDDNGLTKRQQKVYDRLTKIIELINKDLDLKQQEIAEHLGVSQQVISKYLKEIYKNNLQKKNTTEMVTYIISIR